MKGNSADVRVMLGEVMRLVFGKKSERNGSLFSVMQCSLLGVVEGCAFGRILDVQRRRVHRSPLCLLWKSTKRTWWWMFGIVRGRREGSPFTFPGFLMTRT